MNISPLYFRQNSFVNNWRHSQNIFNFLLCTVHQISKWHLSRTSIWWIWPEPYPDIIFDCLQTSREATRRPPVTSSAKLTLSKRLHTVRVIPVNITDVTTTGGCSKLTTLSKTGPWITGQHVGKINDVTSATTEIWRATSAEVYLYHLLWTQIVSANLLITDDIRYRTVCKTNLDLFKTKPYPSPAERDATGNAHGTKYVLKSLWEASSCSLPSGHPADLFGPHKSFIGKRIPCVWNKQLHVSNSIQKPTSF